MCGIAGWVAFDRDLTRERAALEAMTATMACRGPDGGGLHLTRHAALGHRRLAVIDPAGGAQPMAAEQGGHSPAVLSYSGEVFNHRELRTALQHAGHRFRTRSDTEVVLRAYLQWGPRFVDRLNGMYAFALWDARREELLLVRDRMGVKPLHFHRTHDGVLFGSEPKALFAHPALRPEVDLDGLRELLSTARTPGHAVYRGLSEVQPGQVVTVRRSGLTTRRYWALEAREHTDDGPATAAAVRELLADTVRRQLDSDVPLCALLSGGLDSSAITALAAQALRQRGAGPVRTFAVDYAGQTERFRPDAMRGTPDGPYARLLAEHVGADHRTVELDSDTLSDPAHRTAVLRARDLPWEFGDMDTSMLLLFRAVRRDSTVALSGEAADELFGGYPWFHDPALIAAETFPWAALLARTAGLGAGPREGLLDPGLLTGLDLDAYRADRYREAVSAVPQLPGTDPVERRMRELTHLSLTRFVRILLDRKDRLSMACGLEVRVPFCDHRLVQYVFNTPWRIKSSDGREKSLLRAAVRDLLPAAIADRAKSPYPSIQDLRYPRSLQAALGRLAADRDSPAAALLDRGAVAEALAPGADPQYARAATEVVLGIDDWLRTYDVSLVM
ncbi:asparagine synthase (glutamine-hydrolyzing) [Streptomyces sp. NRRL B-24484]|uniref:asparagine synthase (glutamine-hydrolyzing) n=1 Tax=Streptomyces sp. NRRL B-24484 TaxID=1463833 RepID=UPI0004C253A6|nr:asparagine synthase (glutamine-hydrolyzing) [Streptomyces sp. NRRL B-24484]